MTKINDVEQGDRNTKLSRRGFVAAGLSAIAAVGCLSVGLKEALAQSRQTGKPVLTADSINELFADERTNKALGAEAARDIRKFVRDHFTLTKVQAQRLDGLSKANTRQLNDAMKMLSKEGGSLRSTFDNTNDTPTPAGRTNKIKIDLTTPVGSLHLEIT